MSASISIKKKKKILESYAHHMFNASPKRVILNIEGLHTHVDLNSSMIIPKGKF